MESTMKKTGLDANSADLYSKTLAMLAESGIPFMLGGAYALAQYMQFERHTRDLDIFVYRKDAKKVLQVFEKAGYKTEMMFPHWLGKAFCGEDYIDIIFCSGNGIAEVDDVCFENSKDATVLGVPVKVLPVEDIIWSKAYIMERERFDGADIAHVLRACSASIDWHRLLQRFDADWRVLFSHLVLFGFIYPSHKHEIPEWVMKELIAKLTQEVGSIQDTEKKVCRGTLLSRGQYLVDVDNWGYEDARLQPRGSMSAQEIAHWTAAIDS